MKIILNFKVKLKHYVINYDKKLIKQYLKRLRLINESYCDLSFVYY